MIKELIVAIFLVLIAKMCLNFVFFKSESDENFWPRHKLLDSLLPRFFAVFAMKLFIAFVIIPSFQSNEDSWKDKLRKWMNFFIALFYALILVAISWNYLM